MITNMTSSSRSVRRDRRGRVIGRNAWRDMVTTTWRGAHDAWLLEREAACNGWRTEEAEFALSHPEPTLKSTLIGLKGVTP